MPRGIIALVFRAHIVGGTPATTTAETTKLTWPTLNEVGSYSDEAYAVRVLDAFAPSGTTFRSHDGVSVLDDPISFLSSLEAQLVLVMIWDYMRSSLINRRCCAKSWFPGAYLGVPPAGSDNACEDWVHAGADPGQGGIEVVQIRGGAVLRASAR